MRVVRHVIEYSAVMAVRALVALLPAGGVRALGTGLGWLFYTCDARHRRVALANVAMCLPSRTAAEREALVRATFRHFGHLLFELLRFSQLTPQARAALVDVEGAEHVRAAYARGRGVLLFTGHVGFWELQAIHHGEYFQPMGVLARPLDNPWLHRLLERTRGATGNHSIYRQGAVRRVLKTLAEGRGVAMLIDQHMHSPDAIWVQYFERPAATTSTLAALALRTGAPVIPAFALPAPGGRYRFVYEAPVMPPEGDGPEAIHEFTQRCTDVLEMYVRRHPDLWLWMHRRWRDAPVPAPSGDPGMFPAAQP